MTKKELKKDLLTRLLQKLTALGFDKKIYGQTFWKPIEHGRAAVHLSFINHDVDFDVTLHFAIRIEQLEKMKNQLATWLKEKDKKETATIGVELGNLIDGKQKRWTIRENEDVESTANEIFQKVIEIGIPYIEKYSNPEEILSLCIRDDEEAWLNSPIDHDRAKNAVGLAKILNKNDFFEEIIAKKTSYLQKKEHFGLAEFLEFVEKVKPL